MKLISCMWLGIHKYICSIRFIYMSVVRHTWECQTYVFHNIKYALSVKTELNYDDDFLHIIKGCVRCFWTYKMFKLHSLSFHVVYETSHKITFLSFPATWFTFLVFTAASCTYSTQR